MKKHFSMLLLSILLNAALPAQQYTISGIIEDATTGESLVSANVYESSTLQGTISNNYGFYSLKLQAGMVEIVYSYVGYQTIKKTISLNKDTVINVLLAPAIELEEVTVTDRGPANTVRSSQMSLVKIPISEIKSVPVLMGETDVLKTIQLLPGVQSGTEGLSGIYVRGGGPDQNLILLDGVPVYNVNHLFGFFSVFNADAIHNVTLIKGGFPARYGGRLSSVLDIRMKEGNMKKIKGEGSIGLISSKLTIEGPIIKDKTSFIVSARRTYIDILARPLIKHMNNMEGDNFNMNTGYFFYDINAKINHKINNRNRIFYSIYTGKDKFYMNYHDKYEDIDNSWDDKGDMGIFWKNITSALRLNTIINKNLFSNITLTVSDYAFNTGFNYTYITENPGGKETNEFGMSYISGIRDYSARAEIDYIPSASHYIRAGVDFINHTFNPGVLAFKDIYNDELASIDTSFGNKKIFVNDISFYIEDDINIGTRLKTNIGIRYSGFLLKNKNYFSLEPRVSVRYLMNDIVSLKTSYAEMQQSIHLLTNTNIGLPTDLWVPSTDRIKPKRSKQLALGVALALHDQYELTLEGFYKDMNNTIAYKEGESFIDVGSDWQDKIESGKGNAYGMEFMIQKSVGKTTGWIGYTLAWANRQYANISNGKVFPYKYDRRHDISLVISHKINERIDMGLTWVYGTGYHTTLPVEKYVNNLSVFQDVDHGNQWYMEDTKYIEHIDTRNNYKMPDYHRLDLGINFHKEKKHHTRTWSFGAYNAYNRQNAFVLYYNFKDMWEYDPQKDKKVVKQISLFPIIPYFKYSFTF